MRQSFSSESLCFFIVKMWPKGLKYARNHCGLESYIADYYNNIIMIIVTTMVHMCILCIYAVTFDRGSYTPGTTES